MEYLWLVSPICLADDVIDIFCVNWWWISVLSRIKDHVKNVKSWNLRRKLKLYKEHITSLMVTYNVRRSKFIFSSPQGILNRDTPYNTFKLRRNGLFFSSFYSQIIKIAKTGKKFAWLIYDCLKDMERQGKERRNSKP